MLLALEKVSKKEEHILPVSLTLVPRTVNVLRGATQAGKTSLMRLMEGLDKPTDGRVLADGRDVTTCRCPKGETIADDRQKGAYANRCRPAGRFERGARRAFLSFSVKLRRK